MHPQRLLNTAVYKATPSSGLSVTKPCFRDHTTKMKVAAIAPLILPLVVPGVFAWGAEGHEAVGYIAMQFLAPNARSFVESSLGSMYSYSLGPAATWADVIKSKSAYKWSSELHYVDAIDAPPTSCNVDEVRDCGGGHCILSAIANYTSRIVDTTLDDSQRQEALKFLDHFIGDIGQPLHVEAFERGGNNITAMCAGKASNLHAVWDSGIIVQLLKNEYSNSLTAWVDELVSRIQDGVYELDTTNWISCSSTTEPVESDGISARTVADDIASFLEESPAITPLQCPLVWAGESNALVCFDVLNYASRSQDFCAGDYYDAAVNDIQLQIAKQGYRLAAWLNVLFDGSTFLP